MLIRRTILALNMFLLMLMPLQAYAVLNLDNTSMPDCEMHKIAKEMGVDIKNMPNCHSDMDCQAQCDDCKHCYSGTSAAVPGFNYSEMPALTKQQLPEREVSLLITFLSKDLPPPRSI